MSVNNGTKHVYVGQQYISDFTGCTFYYPSNDFENDLRGLYNNKEFVLFNVVEDHDEIDVVISFPNEYDCIHYWKGKETVVTKSKNAHLTYHGHGKRKKATGEIHIISEGSNPLKGKSPYTESFVSSSSDITNHPLPICRMELTETPGSVKPNKEIGNYFNTDISTCFFNTIEVHLAKKGYLKSLAAPVPSDDPWRSMFIYNSMHTFYLKKIQRRPGWFPQALALQTKSFELIILATREYKNMSYEKNAIRYFQTRDYFRELSKRMVLDHGVGFFIEQSPSKPSSSKGKLMSDYLKTRSKKN